MNFRDVLIGSAMAGTFLYTISAAHFANLGLTHLKYKINSSKLITH